MLAMYTHGKGCMNVLCRSSNLATKLVPLTGSVGSASLISSVLYRDYVQRQGPWEQGVPSGLLPGLAKLVKAVLCMALHLRMTSGFPAAILESHWYYSQPVFAR